MKTEIDPSQPKVTVIGNVDPKILIKRLLKAGKQAELLSSGNQSAPKEKREVDMPISNEIEKQKPESEKPKPECEKPKSSDSSCSNTADKNKESKNGGDGSADKAAIKEEKAKESAVISSIPEVFKNENPVPSQPEMNYKNPVPPHPEMSFNVYPNTVPEAGNMKTQTQYYYMVEPYPITVPYYAIPSYATHPLPPTSYGQPYYCHERPVFQPLFQAPMTRVGDYFSDENTVGCSVM